MKRHFYNKGHNKGFDAQGAETAILSGDLKALANVIHLGRGGMASRRSQAHRVVSGILRRGGELPIPEIEDFYEPESSGSTPPQATASELTRTEFEPKRVVPKYTDGQMKQVRKADSETPEQRFARIVITTQIDADHYDAAIQKRPDMSAHFERLKVIGKESLTAWAHYYNETYDVDTGVTQPTIEQATVPYAGSENPVEIHAVRTPNPERAGLPA